MKKAIIIMTFILALLPRTAMAQFSFDVPTIEAYIYDHKTQRSLLLARATLEQSNALLHDYSRDASVEFKEINVDLDKYTRAFDVIDILYQTLRTAFNSYDTYQDVSEKIVGYKDMLTAYYDKCLSRGDIVSTDTLIISVNRNMLERVAEEGDNLYHSFSDLVLYATGAAACTTSNLLLVITAINDSLDNIRRHLNCAYFETWKYIQVRIGYWKAQVYRAKTIPEIIYDAFGRWRSAGRVEY